MVADEALHEAWHLSLGATAQAAMRAEAMTTVIGPKGHIPPGKAEPKDLMAALLESFGLRPGEAVTR